MPLTFDMPYDDLLKYEGINPRPTDFDLYWDRSLSIMRSTNPDVELTPADFQVDFAECYHMYFTGVGGARIYAKLLKPKPTNKPGPALLKFHGYSMSSGDWIDKLPYVAAGFTVAAMDCRGQGGLSQDIGGVNGWTLNGHIVRGLGDSPESMLYRYIFLDTAQLAKIIMNLPEVDENRVGVTGGSQGGGLTIACAALEPGIKKAAPVSPFLSDYQRIWEMDLAKHAYSEIHDWFRRFDPRHEREEEIFTQLGYIDVQHLASRIGSEVLMGIGLMDEICPPSTQFSAYNKITSPKSLITYPDYAHEWFPGLNDQIFEFMMGL